MGSPSPPGHLPPPAGGTVQTHRETCTPSGETGEAERGMPRKQLAESGGDSNTSSGMELISSWGGGCSGGHKRDSVRSHCPRYHLPYNSIQGQDRQAPQEGSERFMSVGPGGDFPGWHPAPPLGPCSARQKDRDPGAPRGGTSHPTNWAFGSLGAPGREWSGPGHLS